MLRDRILARIEIDAEGCWRWTGRLDRDGYGIIAVDHIPRSAHRVAYEALVGPIPAGLQIDHLCRVRCCVNPAHLEPVTGRVNTLRSPITVATINSQKTRCPSGHAYVGVNLYTDPVGGRHCRACHRQQAAEFRQRSTPRGAFKS